MKMGLAGFASLSLPDVLRLRAESAPDNGQEKKAVILVWQPGGCSHLDTYDPKPNATSEYRGPFATIPTNVPGMEFSELLPLQAKIADKITVLRSMRHGSAGHSPGTMRMLAGDPDTRAKESPKYPDYMTVAKYLRSKEGAAHQPAAVLCQH